MPKKLKSDKPTVDLRYKVKINWKEVATWIRNGALGPEIADRIGISAQTLYKRCKQETTENFHQFSAKYKAKLNMRVKELQLLVGEDRNPGMLIWLGKQYCLQREPEPASHQESKPSIIQYIENQREKNDNSGSSRDTEESI